MAQHAKLWSQFGELMDCVADDTKQSHGSAAWDCDAEYARNYVNAFIDARLHVSLWRIWQGRERYDVSVASENVNLDSLSKRLTLVSDHTVLTHAESFPNQLITPPNSVVSIEARVPSLVYLGHYLRAAHSMLRAGRLVYVPNFVRKQHSWAAHGLGSRVRITRKVPDFLVRGEHIIATGPGKTGLLMRTIKPLLVLELPYIEGTSLKDYFAICLEESNSLDALQDYLRQKLLEIEPDDESIDIDLAKLESEIAAGIRAIESELKILRRKSVVQKAGASVAIATAALFALDPNELTHLLPQILGVGGAMGAWSACTATIDHSNTKNAIKDRPFYLLWLFKP